MKREHRSFLWLAHIPATILQMERLIPYRQGHRGKAGAGARRGRLGRDPSSAICIRAASPVSSGLHLALYSISTLRGMVSYVSLSRARQDIGLFTSREEGQSITLALYGHTITWLLAQNSEGKKKKIRIAQKSPIYQNKTKIENNNTALEKHSQTSGSEVREKPSLASTETKTDNEASNKVPPVHIGWWRESDTQVVPSRREFKVLREKNKMENSARTQGLLDGVFKDKHDRGLEKVKLYIHTHSHITAQARPSPARNILFYRCFPT